MINRGMVLGAALLLALPATAQTVRSGIEAWQQGNHAAAVAIWTSLAAKGDADAAFNLGQAYRLGKGAAMDHGRAQQYFEQAALTGHIDAAATLGILLFQNGNRNGAMRWLKLAADGGETRSMLLYGVALYNGDGIAPEPVTAYAYVSRAAAQGLATAKTTLADLDESMPLEQRQKGLAMARSMVGTQAGAAAAKAPSPLKVAVPEKAKAPAKVAVPAKAKSPAKVAIPVKPPSRAAPPSANSGGWRIQLGAFGQRAGAEALFAKLRGKVAARQPYYVTAGKVVRLQVGPYNSRAAAAAGCAALRGQACFPVAAR